VGSHSLSSFDQNKTINESDSDINQTFWLEEYDGIRYWDKQPQNGLVISSSAGEEWVPGPGDEVRLIIQLHDFPAAEYELKLSDSLSPNSRDLFLKSYMEMLNIKQDQLEQSLLSAGIEFIELARHIYLFNGITLLTNVENINYITFEKDVYKIYPDYEMKAELSESVPLIGAPEMWELTTPGGTPITGVDKLVAIVDSGIDYTHPDLGGCFGPGCKVIDGYDFVNLDSDPFDDFGHGTHVAGIVAANGILKGVAPDALLLSYKVLDENGSGNASDVISAIEMAVLAHADIINISLGGPGNPDDPLCQSVELATEMGTVVVVSSGNRGPNYASIDSPGVAEKAITVGASTKTDGIASFSSRGPVTDPEMVLKPDILAPGQSILSTVPVDGILGSPSTYKVLNGTSMAAPHVAGAAALLRQMYPSWSPKVVKAVLMDSALSLGYNPFIQGAGRLDCTRLLQFDTLINPPLLDFGIDDLSSPSWTKEKFFDVTNWSESQKDFSINLSSLLPTGFDLFISPISFNLNPGQTQKVSVQISVDNQILPNALTPPYSYLAELIVNDGIKEFPVPLGFVKMPSLDIQFNDDPWIVVVHDRSELVRTSSFDYHPIFFLPEGTYDVLIQFLDGKTRLVKEQVPLNSLTQLEFNLADATNKIDLVMKDIHNHTIPFEGLKMDQRMPTALVLKDSNLGIYSLGRSCINEPICDHLNFSEMSEAYSFEITIPAQSEFTEQAYYRFYHKLNDGISSNMVLENQPEDLKPVLFQYPTPENSSSMTVVRWIGSKTVLSTEESAFNTLHFPFTEQTYYQTVDPNGVMILEMISAFSGNSVPSSPFPGEYQTPFYYSSDPSTLEILALNDLESSIFQLTGDTLKINLAPPHWMAELGINEESYWVSSRIGAKTLFSSQAQDFKPHAPLNYILSNNNGVLSTGFIRDSQALPLIETGPYQLKIFISEYTIGVAPGSAQVYLEFNTTLDDNIPPVLTSLAVFANSQMINVLPLDNPSILQIEFTDSSLISRVELFYGENGAWVPLLPVITSRTASALLPLFPAHEYIDIKVILEDEYGNSLTYILNPGLLSGSNFQYIFPLSFN
ncbi:MAG: S8 family serine peptidase, partial [Anaerolineaceae bacterium]|nr:S8 family serine peptidase [Anaerolineaceae bacterium]